MGGSHDPVDIAIIVALAEELESLVAQIDPGFTSHRRDDVGGYDYRFEIRASDGAAYSSVASLIGGMGPELATRHTERLITRWDPTSIVIVGIAAGIHKDVRLGDVIVADQVDAYLTTTKAVSAGTSFELQHRGQVYACDHEVIEDVKHFTWAWRTRHEQFEADCRRRLQSLLHGLPPSLSEHVAHAPRVHVARIASGPVVGAAEAFSSWLADRDSGLVALEMESAGVLASIHERRSRIRAVVVRGVSDFGDHRKASFDAVKNGAFRKYAMQNALAFMRAMIDSRLLGAPRETAPQQFELGNNNIVAEVVEWLAAPIPKPSLAGLRVLVVDDQPAICTAIRRVLQGEGATATLAHDAGSALTAIDETDVDVIVADVMMPGRSGVELADAIRTKFPEMPLLFQSGHFHQSRALPLGADFVAKPFSNTELIERLWALTRDERWLALARRVPALRRRYYRLASCRRAIVELQHVQHCSDLLDTVLRHKVRDVIRAFARDVVFGGEPLEAIERLYRLVTKLSEITSVARYGVNAGCVAYLRALREDLVHSYRGLEFELDCPDDIDAALPGELVPLFLLCSSELVDNARNALRGAGNIRVALRRWTSRPVVSLSVWSNSGPIDASVVGRLFEEGVSSNGPGRGFGLALVKQFAGRVGGTIEVARGDGPDVEFVLTVPVVAPTHS